MAINIWKEAQQEPVRPQPEQNLRASALLAVTKIRVMSKRA
jgi:hypothetical protein